mmetsp:Transcript_70628/g.183305  ORF Transcript_70628/g.183305 Transcript_70628/m.183305 type:complete len:210 (-) Transcript_70628:556-1185(-)
MLRNLPRNPGGFDFDLAFLLDLMLVDEDKVLVGLGGHARAEGHDGQHARHVDGLCENEGAVDGDHDDADLEVGRVVLADTSDPQPCRRRRDVPENYAAHGQLDEEEEDAPEGRISWALFHLVGRTRGDHVQEYEEENHCGAVVQQTLTLNERRDLLRCTQVMQGCDHGHRVRGREDGGQEQRAAPSHDLWVRDEFHEEAGEDDVDHDTW